MIISEQIKSLFVHCNISVADLTRRFDKLFQFFKKKYKKKSFLSKKLKLITYIFNEKFLLMLNCLMETKIYG